MFVTNRPASSIPSDLVGAIAALKQELNAVILAHYYQESEIQDVADFIGDSLELSRRAADTPSGCDPVCGGAFYGRDRQDS
jgi:quinolinate synthase